LKSSLDASSYTRSPVSSAGSKPAPASIASLARKRRQTQLTIQNDDRNCACPRLLARFLGTFFRRNGNHSRGMTESSAAIYRRVYGRKEQRPVGTLDDLGSGLIRPSGTASLPSVPPGDESPGYFRMSLRDILASSRWHLGRIRVNRTWLIVFTFHHPLQNNLVRKVEGFPGTG